MVRLLTIAGLALIFVALLINPVAPLLTTVQIPASLSVPADGSAPPTVLQVGQHAGWKIAFRDNGMIVTGVDFFFVEPLQPARGKILLSVNAPTHTRTPFYQFDVVVAPLVHVDLSPSIPVYAETWSFEFLDTSGISEILPGQTPPSSGDLYKSISPLGSVGPAFGLGGTKDALIPQTEARFSYAVQGLQVTVHDESRNAQTTNWSWGDGTYDDGVLGETRTHTYSTAGTYTVVLNVRGGFNGGKDSAQADITLNQLVAGDTGSHDWRLPAFLILVAVGVFLIFIGLRRRR